MTGSLGALLTEAAALLAVLLLITAGVRLFRARGWAAPARAGKVLVLRESVALDTKRRLHLVQCGGRQVVLLTGGAQDVVVGWIEPPT